MIDIAVPGDVRVERKEDEKVEKYRDLCRELGKLWKVRCSVVPIVVGVLRAVPKRLPSYLALLDINLSLELLQKSAILGTTRVYIEEGVRDGQRVWCAQALRQSSPQTGNLPSAVQEEDNNNMCMQYV